MKPDHRVHGIVEGKDWAPGSTLVIHWDVFSVLIISFLVIPDYAKMRWFVRAPTGSQLKVWRERVVKCFEFVPLG